MKEYDYLRAMLFSDDFLNKMIGWAQKPCYGPFFKSWVNLELSYNYDMFLSMIVAHE